MNRDSTAYEIKTQKEYEFARSALTKQNLPHVLLRALMRAVESYRSKRKYGWSRPWNKNKLINFQSFRLTFPADDSLRQHAREVLSNHAAELNGECQTFIADLFADPCLMAFIFVHEHMEDYRFFEGATLSFGRVKEKRYRDRLDIIVESEIVGGRSLGHTRTRIYIDPFRGADAISPLQKIEITKPFGENETELFRILAECSWEWQGQSGRAWDHWTSSYIDYFAPRQFPMTSSYFFSENPFCERNWALPISPRVETTAP